MSGLVSRKGWLKAERLGRVLVILCVLVFFAPQADQSTGSVSTPISISSSNNDYALLPATSPLKTNNYPAKVKQISRGICGKTVLVKRAIVPLLMHSNFKPNHNSLPGLNPFGTIFQEDLQQACRLLDMPPPSVLVSL